MYGHGYQPVYRQRLSLDQASAIALGQIPGQIIHVDMEMEDGQLVYEFFIATPDNRVFEVEVAARTGNILKIEDETND